MSPTSLALTCFHCSILGLKRTIDDTRPSPPSMNELTTKLVIRLIIAKDFVIQNAEILESSSFIKET